MADLVINNKVSMEWEKRGFYVKGGKFYFASKEYDTANGKLCVFFTTDMAFTFFDEEGDFGLKDMMSFAQKDGNISDRFPCDYDDNYNVLARPYVGEGFVNNKLIEQLGLTEFTEDIVNRVKDLSDYDRAIDAQTGKELDDE